MASKSANAVSEHRPVARNFVMLSSLRSLSRRAKFWMSKYCSKMSNFRANTVYPGRSITYSFPAVERVKVADRTYVNFPDICANLVVEGFGSLSAGGATLGV
jgi:hypothetical protein